MRESAIGAITEDRGSIEQWKKIRLRAKKSMRRGARAINPSTGAGSDVKDHYYTDGAMRLALQGVKMLTVAGWIEYEFQ